MQDDPPTGAETGRDPALKGQAPQDVKPGVSNAPEQANLKGLEDVRKRAPTREDDLAEDSGPATQEGGENLQR